MSRNPDVDEALTRLEDGVEREDPQGVIDAGAKLRSRLSELVAERTLQVEDPVLAQRRIIHQRLEVLEAKAQAGRFEDAGEDREAVAELAVDLCQVLRDREVLDEPPPSAGETPSTAFGFIARREAIKLAGGMQGGMLATVSLLVFGLALASARPVPMATLASVWSSALEPMLVLAPLAGMIAGLGLVSEDAQRDRLAVLATAGLSRGAIVAAKALGSIVASAALLVGPALLVGIAGVLFGLPSAPIPTAVFLAAIVLLASSFTAIALTLDVVRGRAFALAGTVAWYVLVGPVWRAAFLAGEVSSQSGALGALIVYLASPVAAARWLIEAAGARAEAVSLGLLVLALWSLAGLGFAAMHAQREGFASPRNR